MKRTSCTIRRLLAGVAFILVLTLVGQALAQGGVWETKAPLPTARFDLRAAAIGGFLYAVSGQNGITGDVPTVNKYDPATNTWSTVAPLPDTSGTDGRYGGAIGAIDGKIYLPGGWHTSPALPTSTLLIYDPGSDSWSLGPSLPYLSACSVAGVIDGKLYLLTACNGFSGFRKLFAVFDPVASTWTNLPEPPNHHVNGAGGVIDGKFYVAGGGPAWGLFDGLLDVYDPATNSWSTKASMPTPRQVAAAGVIGGKLYVVGGWGGSLVDVMEVYDPVTDSWSTAPPLPTPRHGTGAAVIDGSLYVVGGHDGFGPSDTLEVFSPGDFVVSVDIDIKPGSDPNSINLSSAGVVPVAILSSDTFDALSVDPDTVSLAGARVKMVGKSDRLLCHAEDVNGDGWLDLVCQVLTAEFMIEVGESVAVLEAETFDGIPIHGEDTIRIVPDE